MDFYQMEGHLEEAHGIDSDEAREGDDYFFNRVHERDSHVEDGIAISFINERDDIEQMIAEYEAATHAFDDMDIFQQDQDFFAGLMNTAFPFPDMLMPGDIVTDSSDDEW